MKTKMVIINLNRALIALIFSLWVSNSFAQCEQAPAVCGPGPQWVENCSAGVDIACSKPEVGVDMDGDCVSDLTVDFEGNVEVKRSNPEDIIVTGHCPASNDGTNDVIETEILSLVATGSGFTLIIGDTVGNGDLRASLGNIVQLSTDNTQACSDFTVWFKVITPTGDTLYNHKPLLLQTFIDQVPPATESYEHVELGCIHLFPCSPDKPGGCDASSQSLVEPNHGVCKMHTHIHNPVVLVGGDLNFSVYIQHNLDRTAITPITFKIADINGNVVYSRQTGPYTFNKGDDLSLDQIIKLPSNLSPGSYFLMFDILGMSSPLAKGQPFTIHN